MTLHARVERAMEDARWNLPQGSTHGQTLAAYADAALATIVTYLRDMAHEASAADSPRCEGTAWLNEAANRIEGANAATPPQSPDTNQNKES